MNLEGISVKRAVLWLVIGCMLMVLASCGGGNGETTPTGTTQLQIQLFQATPTSGSSPLRVTFTAVIKGGTAPYNYAFDFDNDGAVDQYLNAEYRTTVTVQHDYYLRALGADSNYKAVLRVIDTDGATIPAAGADAPSVDITVLGSSVMTVRFDWTTNTPIDGGGFRAVSGEPVFFSATITGGQAPYNYQWDFTNDGSADSTVATPQYTFTYTGDTFQDFPVHLTVTDRNGEQASYPFGTNPFPDYIVRVFPPGVVPPTDNFDIILNSSPAADANDVITLLFDPTGSDPNLPLEPELDLSIVVIPVDSGGAVPPRPYEYYWDFENDGAIDSQFQSPTIPYYDSVRKILVNPYLTQEQQKSFTLRCMVISPSGVRKEIFRTVLAKRAAGIPAALTVQTQWGSNFVGSGFVDPPQPYAIGDYDQTDPTLTTKVINFLFNATMTGPVIPGSTGKYEWQLDIDGDGVADYPQENGVPTGWAEATAAGNGASMTQIVKFGPGDFDNDPGTPDTIQFMPIGYYPCKLSIRAVDNSSQVVDSAVMDVPVSMVAKGAVFTEAIAALTERTEATMEGFVASSGANPLRYAVIAGGAEGNSSLRSVDQIVDIYDTVALSWTTTASAQQPLNFDRRGAMTFNLPTQTAAFDILVGGFNITNSILASSEYNDIGGISGGGPWTIFAEINAPDYLPLRDGINFPFYILNNNYNVQGMMLCGGLHPPAASDVDDVNGKLISFDPAGQLRPFGPVFLDVNVNMVTERYDGAAAFTNNRMYVIGGRVASGQSVKTVEAFNFLTSQWEGAPELLDARSGHCAVTINGLIYVFGGAYYPAVQGTKNLVTTAEVFNPVTGVWSHTVPPALPTDNGAATILPSRDAIVKNQAAPSLNAAWYFGGQNANMAETRNLEEFVYFIPQ